MGDSTDKFFLLFPHDFQFLHRICKLLFFLLHVFYCGFDLLSHMIDPLAERADLIVSSGNFKVIGSSLYLFYSLVQFYNVCCIGSEIKIGNEKGGEKHHSTHIEKAAGSAFIEAVFIP